MPRPQMPRILGTDASLDRKRNLGMMVVVSGMLYLKPVARAGIC